jgi:hypothetical protein
LNEPSKLQARWRRLVETDLPKAAALRPDWPVCLDHCFAHILLARPWRETARPPAGSADLAALNRRSLAMRGKPP